MVRHQGPSQTAHPPLRKILTNSVEERFSIGIVEKDRAFFNSAGVHVMYRTREIDSGSPRHIIGLIKNQTKEDKRPCMEEGKGGPGD